MRSFSFFLCPHFIWLFYQPHCPCILYCKPPPSQSICSTQYRRHYLGPLPRHHGAAPYIYAKLQLSTLPCCLKPGGVNDVWSVASPGPPNLPFFISLNPAHAFVCSPFIRVFLITQFMQAICFQPRPCLLPTVNVLGVGLRNRPSKWDWGQCCIAHIFKE